MIVGLFTVALSVFATIGVLAVCYLLVFKIPMDMARRRNRNPVFWAVISLAFAFPLAIFLLWILGPAGKT